MGSVQALVGALLELYLGPWSDKGLLSSSTDAVHLASMAKLWLTPSQTSMPDSSTPGVRQSLELYFPPPTVQAVCHAGNQPQVCKPHTSSSPCVVLPEGTNAHK
jgi:hypothetical protein